MDESFSNTNRISFLSNRKSIIFTTLYNTECLRTLDSVEMGVCSRLEGL